MLRRIAIDELGIYPSLVGNLPLDSDNAAIVVNVIAMSHGLGVAVVAHGVETDARFDFVGSRSCDEYQSPVLVCKPMTTCRILGSFSVY